MLTNFVHLTGGAIELAGVWFERRAYADPRQPRNPSAFESLFLYVVRTCWGLERDAFRAVSLPATVSLLRQLFERLDDLMDSGAAFPSMSDIKSDPLLALYVRQFIDLVASLDIPRSSKRALLRLAARERSRQIRLQKTQHEYSPSIMPGAAALSLREQAGGSMTRFFPHVAALQLGLPDARVRPALDATYNFGVNLQLLDDLVDVIADTQSGAQNVFRSYLNETGDEYKVLTNRIRHPADVTYQAIERLAPRSLRRLEETRRTYYDRVEVARSFRFLKFIASPRNSARAFALYQRKTAYKMQRPVPQAELNPRRRAPPLVRPD